MTDDAKVLILVVDDVVALRAQDVWVTPDQIHPRS
jgi:hypothetical protein